MSLDTWIYAQPSAWDAIAPQEGEPEQIWHYTYRNAVTRFWKPYPGGYEVYNVLGSQAQVQGILDSLEAQQPGSVQASYSWIQGPAYDDLDYWPTDPNEVLAVMPDHIEYDENGDIVSQTPATIENPNWAHVFLGQSERIFAGSFSDEFTGEFL